MFEVIFMIVASCVAAIFGILFLLACGVFVFVMVGLVLGIISGIVVGIYKSLTALSRLPLWACSLVGILFFLSIGLIFGQRLFH